MWTDTTTYLLVAIALATMVICIIIIFDLVALAKSLISPRKGNAYTGERWITHKGDKCPVPLNTLVDLKFRGGRVTGPCIAEDLHDPCPQFSCWVHDGSDADIVAYRKHKG
jgi:hypothetical protein